MHTYMDGLYRIASLKLTTYTGFRLPAHVLYNPVSERCFVTCTCSAGCSGQTDKEVVVHTIVSVMGLQLELGCIQVLSGKVEGEICKNLGGNGCTLAASAECYGNPRVFGN